MEIGNQEFRSDRELFVCYENISEDVAFSVLINVLQVRIPWAIPDHDVNLKGHHILCPC